MFNTLQPNIRKTFGSEVIKFFCKYGFMYNQNEYHATKVKQPMKICIILYDNISKDNTFFKRRKIL